MMRASLLDIAPPAMTREVAGRKLVLLREELSDRLAKVSPSKSTMLHIGNEVKRITAEIAEVRKILGPPRYIPRDFTNAKQTANRDTA